MTNEIAFQFDDLGIDVDGSECGSFSGEAVVSYYPEDGSWFVNHISVWCDDKKQDGFWGRSLKSLPLTHRLYTMIWPILSEEGRWQDAILEQIAEECGTEFIGRPDWVEHATHAGAI